LLFAQVRTAAIYSRVGGSSRAREVSAVALASAINKMLASAVQFNQAATAQPFLTTRFDEAATTRQKCPAGRLLQADI
jgi:hypothetical protein